MKEKQGILSLKTQAGCLRLLALFVGGYFYSASAQR